MENDYNQISVDDPNVCKLINKESQAGLLLDFGFEIHGGIQINVINIGNQKNTARLRVRFGESAMEAMSDLEGPNNANNDHAVRDTTLEVSQYGMNEFGNTGFRFVRIDLCNQDCYIEIKSIQAILLYRDLEYKGYFNCSDDLLNQIWETGAYTVHLNMQEMLWDGIKRDRLVWAGDLHPEVKTILTVFGSHEIIKNSLDFVKDKTPLPNWMNGISTYSMWWIIINYDLYVYTGNKEYLKSNQKYILSLLKQIIQYTEKNGLDKMDYLFLDWPTSENQPATRAGVHAILKIAIDCGKRICHILNKKNIKQMCSEASQRLEKNIPDHAQSKQAAALMVMANLLNAKEANQNVLAVDGAQRMSTFKSYYILKARSLAGDIKGSLESVRNYYGAMLKAGATTFWEDFNIDWMQEGSTIENVVSEKSKDIHGINGDYCYQGYRHSLCHGWSSGPTSWLSEEVLGVKLLKAGFEKVILEPHLADLKWVKGKFPTPFGIIEVEHQKKSNDEIETFINAPREIEIITAEGLNNVELVER